MLLLTMKQWDTIEQFLTECMKSNHKCAHCANYDDPFQDCAYSVQCFSNDMFMYDEGDDES